MAAADATTGHLDQAHVDRLQVCSEAADSVAFDPHPLSDTLSDVVRKDTSRERADRGR
jgi:hypothetical protein